MQLGENFAYDTTAQLSCHVQHSHLMVSLEFKSQQDESSKDFNYELIIQLWNGQVSKQGQFHPKYVQ